MHCRAWRLIHLHRGVAIQNLFSYAVSLYFRSIVGLTDRFRGLRRGRATVGLLDHVREFVSQQPGAFFRARLILSRTEDDVLAHSVGMGVDSAC